MRHYSPLLLAVFVLACSEEATTSSKATIKLPAEPAFSTTDYQLVREMVAPAILSENARKEKSIKSKVALAKLDLNQDGAADYIARIKHPDFCGLRGCAHHIFIATSGKLRQTNSFSLSNIQFPGGFSDDFAEMLLDYQYTWQWSPEQKRYVTQSQRESEREQDVIRQMDAQGL